MLKVAVVPGDGIGPEVMAEALRVLRNLDERMGLGLSFETVLAGGASIDATGHPLTDEAMSRVKGCGAVLLGAVGGPKWDGLPPATRPEQALFRLRRELDVFANLRPVFAHPSLVAASTLRPEVVAGVDMVVVREITGGIYFGKPRGVEQTLEGDERALNTMVYTGAEVARVARVAFELARKRRRKVTSVDKANVLECSQLWRRVVSRLHEKDYADVALDHLYVDNAAMQIVRAPARFDVLLTENLFGDILSDEAAVVAGSIGMCPSASVGGKVGLFEPVHGSAPDIAGEDKANPLAMILSAALMLRWSFAREDGARAIEGAVDRVLRAGWRTPDLVVAGEDAAKAVGCKGMGDRVLAEMGRES